MKASLTPILDVLERPDTQYVIPVFQRVYSWSQRQCDQLWNDMMTAGRDGKAHFMGTLIHLPESKGSTGVLESSLIDGQQRLTTITLMLIALRDALAASHHDDQTQAQKIDAEYLHAKTGIPKLQLSEEDATTLDCLVDGRQPTNATEPSKLLLENRELFKAKVESASFDPEAMVKGLESLTVVAVELEADDAPQQVFESLNAKGRPLSTTDLLRNALLARYGSEEQDRLLDQYWAPIDDAFAKFGAEQDIYLDAALHSWIANSAPGVQATKRNELYQAFKGYLAGNAAIDLEGMLASINAACLEFAKHPDSPEAKAHLDWAIDKPKGMISQRKIFGD